MPRLTDAILEAEVAKATDHERTVWDSELRGFGLRILPTGKATFILKYRVGNQQRKYRIGPWPMAAKDARKLARKRLGEIAAGQDPQAHRKAERTALTMKDLIQRYEAQYLPRKRSSSQTQDLSLINQFIRPAFEKEKVADIAYQDIEKLHAEVSQRAPYRANRLVALLSKMFSLSIKWGMRTDNPCKGIDRNPEHKRTRYLNADELARLSKALDEHTNQTAANVLRLLLLTGARRGEVLNATWVQFDLDRGVWTKPGSTTKQKTEHRVPLSEPVIELLRSIPTTDDRLFRIDGNALQRHWRVICAKAGISDFRIHDCRHQYASTLVSAGLSLPIIGSLLGHTQASTTHRYAHLFDDPLRAATNIVGQLWKAQNGTDR